MLFPNAILKILFISKMSYVQCRAFTDFFLFNFHIPGVIRTALHNMDREAREHYSVVIQAKDMAGQVGGLSGSTTVNITLTDVNDNPPRFPQSMYLWLTCCIYHHSLCKKRNNWIHDVLFYQVRAFYPNPAVCLCSVFLH